MPSAASTEISLGEYHFLLWMLSLLLTSSSPDVCKHSRLARCKELMSTRKGMDSLRYFRILAQLSPVESLGKSSAWSLCPHTWSATAVLCPLKGKRFWATQEVTHIEDRFRAPGAVFEGSYLSVAARWRRQYDRAHYWITRGSVAVTCSGLPLRSLA